MFKFISNSDHYGEVLGRVQSVKRSLWIGTADIKDLYVEVGKEKKPAQGLLSEFSFCVPEYDIRLCYLCSIIVNRWS